MFKLKKILVVGLLGFGVVTIFQNCDTAKFSKAGGGLVSVEDNSAANLGSNSTPPSIEVPPPPPNDPPPSNPPPEEPPPANPPPVDPPPNPPPPPPPPPTDDGDPDDHADCDDHDHDGDHHEDPVSGRLYVCVVKGPGKSHKVAYVNGELIGKVATPQDVCMSRKACEEIVSQVFEVKSAEKRGFCPDKNPHVVNFSEDEIQQLVDQLK